MNQTGGFYRQDGLDQCDQGFKVYIGRRMIIFEITFIRRKREKENKEKEAKAFIVAGHFNSPEI